MNLHSIIKFIGIPISAMAMQALVACSTDNDLSQNISDLETTLTEEDHRKVKDIRKIKKFAEEDLGLECKDAFSEMGLNPENSKLYWVYASHGDRIESVFKARGVPFEFKRNDKF